MNFNLILFLANDYSSFLSLGGLYLEPTSQVNSIRMVVFLDQRLSLYCGTPYKTAVLLSTALPDDVLNGSL